MEHLHDAERLHPAAAAPVRQARQAYAAPPYRTALAEIAQASARMQAQGRLCQFVADSPRMRAQRAPAASAAASPAAAPLRGGAPLPDELRHGIFQLSGIDLGRASVHRNSPAPGRIQAHAYAHAG